MADLANVIDFISKQATAAKGTFLEHGQTSFGFLEEAAKNHAEAFAGDAAVQGHTIHNVTHHNPHSSTVEWSQHGKDHLHIHTTVNHQGHITASKFTMHDKTDVKTSRHGKIGTPTITHDTHVGEPKAKPKSPYAKTGQNYTRADYAKASAKRNRFAREEVTAEWKDYITEVVQAITETENIDELSVKTLGSYRNKALGDVANRTSTRDPKEHPKIHSRVAGMDRAEKKIDDAGKKTFANKEDHTKAVAKRDAKDKADAAALHAKLGGKSDSKG